MKLKYKAAGGSCREAVRQREVVMKIAVSAESTVDLTPELIEKYDVKIVPFTVILGDKSGYDGEITSDEIISFVNEHKILPKTSAVNEEQYTEHFSKILGEYDAVVHFSLSSELSAAYGNAVKAAAKFKNVFVADSRTLSTGIALLVIYAKKLIDKGLSPQEVYEKACRRIPYVQASFELKRVDYLYKGGRCSALALLGANLFKIRPQIILKEGRMIAGKKYRGNFEHVVKCYVKDILEQFNNPDKEEVFLTYTTANPRTLAEVREILKERGFKNINVTRAGATITSHCGEDCLGILYINDGGENA